MMSEETRLESIRESERKSHIEMYSNEELYKEGSWLSKPIKTVLDIIPVFEGYRELNVLDLGCGVGRNSIAIAKAYNTIVCNINCVDLLDYAIEKLNENADNHGVLSFIHGIVKPIEEYAIEKNKYDLIMAVSALEHIDSEKSFIEKLQEIETGIQQNGIVCLVINSEVKERDKLTGTCLYPQFEVNFSTDELQKLLKEIFVNWQIIKSNVQEQQYDVPRENRMSDLKTNVVTLVARKC